MNFIGHALLAQAGNDDFLLGNLIADGIKGPNLEQLTTDVASGVRWHRHVDARVDRHPIVLELLDQMPERRVAGIALDIVWDHFLASHVLRPSLAERCYQLLHDRPLPARQATMFEHLVKGRWLEGYADFEFTLQAIEGVGRRLRGSNRLARLTPWLSSHYGVLGDAYHRFWPDVCQHLSWQK